MDRKFIQISEIMSQNPVTVEKGSSVAKAAEVMAKYRVGSLVVMDQDDVVGIVTAHDIIFKVVSLNKNPSSLLIDDVMSNGVISVTPNNFVNEVMHLLNENDIKQVPVILKDKLVGFVTMKDILRIEPTLVDMAIDTFRSEEQQRKVYLEQAVQRSGFVDVDKLINEEPEDDSELFDDSEEK